MCSDLFGRNESTSVQDNPQKDIPDNLSDMAFMANKIYRTAKDLYYSPGRKDKVWNLLDKAERIAYLAGYRYPSSPVPMYLQTEQSLITLFKYAQTIKISEEASASAPHSSNYSPLGGNHAVQT